MTELRIRTARPKPTDRVLTLADKIEVAIEALYQVLPHARDQRRAPGDTTDNVLDRVDAVGAYLKKSARGG